VAGGGWKWTIDAFEEQPIAAPSLNAKAPTEVVLAESERREAPRSVAVHKKIEDRTTDTRQPLK
jgi:hypothetical protein